MMVGAFSIDLFRSVNKEPLEQSVTAVISSVEEYKESVSSPYLVYGSMDPSLASGLYMTVSSTEDETPAGHMIVKVNKGVEIAVFPSQKGEYTIYAVDNNTGKYAIYESRLEAYVPAEADEVESKLRTSQAVKPNDPALGKRTAPEFVGISQ